MELLKLTNTGQAPVLFNGNEKVTIPAGATKIVTWDFACAWLGRPDIELPEERSMAYKLVCLMWGYSDGEDTAASWAEKKPSITVTTIDDEPVWMLIDDPERNRPMPGEPDIGNIDSSDALVLKAQLARQAEQMARLEALITQMQAPATPELDPATQTALATTESAATASTTELPKPVETPKNAADKPQQTRTRVS